jgi:hypothetical protein
LLQNLCRDLIVVFNLVFYELIQKKRKRIQTLTLAGHQGKPFNFAKTVSPGRYSFGGMLLLSEIRRARIYYYYILNIK